MKNIPIGFKYILLFVTGLCVSGVVFAVVLDKKIQELEDKINVKRVLYKTSIPTGSNLAFEPTNHFELSASKTVDAVVFIKTSDSDGLTYLFDGGAGSSGSGVIISPDGYIVTNHHVIDNASKVRVTLNNKSEYEGQIIAFDPNTDLAVIKIDAQNLPTVAFANSNMVHIGQWVLAVGNPFNLNSTVTAGIVSAKARNIGVIGSNNMQTGFDYSIESFIQTDAAVNPGNSGGALVNLNGELIGVNTAIATETGNFAGYSFAIPANLVKKVITDLIEYGEVQRGFLGVSIRDIDAQMGKRQDLKTLSGAIVADVAPNGAAKEAGLKEGDIITHVQDRQVHSSSELQEEVANYRPADKITVKGFRGNNPFSFTVILKNIKGGTGLIKKSTTEKKPRIFSSLGASFGELSSSELQKLKIPYGIRVNKVSKMGSFAALGIPEGFIITKIDKTPLESYNHFLTLLENQEGVLYIEGIKTNGKNATFILKKPSE